MEIKVKASKAFCVVQVTFFLCLARTLGQLGWKQERQFQRPLFHISLGKWGAGGCYFFALLFQRRDYIVYLGVLKQCRGRGRQTVNPNKLS